MEQSHAGLADRLSARQVEIEQAAMIRIRAVADPAESRDLEYIDGLRAAVTAAVEYGIEAIERSETHPPPMPTALLSQARLAARCGVKLETVVRRYVAGYSLLGDFMVEESARGGLLNGTALTQLLRVQASLLDRVIAAVSEEHAREMSLRPGSTDQRIARVVGGMLEGQMIGASELPYDLDAVHIAAVGKGPGVDGELRTLATSLDRSLLLVLREGSVWAWLGGRGEPDLEWLAREAHRLPDHISLSIGEPGDGLPGWRLSHRQAQAALPIAVRRPGHLVRYGDVALLASMLRDDLLAVSLRQLFLDPLSEERDGGAALRKTLRAYLAAERNASSTAAALGVKRHTVTNRLRTIEERLGRSLSTCTTEIDAALRLEGLERAGLC